MVNRKLFFDFAGDCADRAVPTAQRTPDASVADFNVGDNLLRGVALNCRCNARRIANATAFALFGINFPHFFFNVMNQASKRTNVVAIAAVYALVFVDNKHNNPP